MTKKKEVEKPEKSPKKTRNGNELFNGAESGKPFEKGVKKTEAEKQAMREGWARKRIYEELFNKITTNLGIRIDEDTMQAKDLIDSLKVVIEALGDKVDKHEFSGAVNIAPPIININPVKSNNEL